MQNPLTYRDDIKAILDMIEQVMFGKSHITKLILIAIICNDHILLEDVPGTGKTYLINTLAKILDLKFKRIQGTSDLLPSDLTGISIYNQKEGQFNFIEGPIFTNILLFDEINRSSPKTQSALLEAMAENQVSIDNITYKLESPFFVLATQNPIEHLGTYPLPQAQLDRFLIKTQMGYPEKIDERKIMLQLDNDIFKFNFNKFHKDIILKWQADFNNIYIKDNMVDKILNVVHKTRSKDKFALGISPRSAKKFIRALRASAYIHNREFVTKDDIFDLYIPVFAHKVLSGIKNEEVTLLTDLFEQEGF